MIRMGMDPKNMSDEGVERVRQHLGTRGIDTSGASDEDIRNLLNAGADKVSINSAAVANPTFVSDMSEAYGAQAIVGNFLQTFKEFPPRQKAASFTVDQAMEKLKPQAH